METGEYHNKCLPLGSAWYSYSIFYMLDRKIILCLLASANSFEAECSGGRCVGRCWRRGKGLARGGRSNKSSCGTIPTATCPAHKIPFGSLRWQWNCSQCSIRNVYVYHIYIHTHVTCICICICVYQRLLSFGYLKSSTRAYTGVPAASQQLVKRVYPKKEVSCSAFHIASLGVGIQVQVRNSNQVHNKNQHGGHPVTPSKAIRNCRTGQERHSTFVYTKWATGKKVQLFHIYSIWVERWPVKHP